MTSVSRETSRLSLRLPAFAVLAVLVLILAGCTSVAQPKGWAAPVVDGDTIYLSIRGKHLVAVARNGGAERWRFPDGRTEEDIELEGIYGEPAVAGDRILIGDHGGNLYSIATANGSLEWTARTDGSIIGAIAVSGDLAIVGSGDGYVYAFALSDGTQRWRTPLDDHIWSRPIIRDSIAYVPALDGRLAALEVATGTIRVQPVFKAAAGLPTTGALAGDRIIVGSLDKRLYAVNIADGSAAWSFPGQNWFWTTPLVDGDRVYAGNLDHVMYALNLANGSLQWQYNTGAPLRSAPVISGSTLVLASTDGVVHGIDAAKGERKWTTTPLDTNLYANLTLDGAVVYIQGENGAIWTVRPDDGSLAQFRAKP